jgi:environmental stress-induced protein Ves
MVLLRGQGLDLKFGNGEHRELCSCGDWVQFDGAAAVHCELRAGPCVDLNLIVAKSSGSTVRIDRSRGSSVASASADGILLVFSLEAPLSLQDDAGNSVRLEPWDLAVLTGSARFDRMAPATPGAVFIANISQ